MTAFDDAPVAAWTAAVCIAGTIAASTAAVVIVGPGLVLPALGMSALAGHLGLDLFRPGNPNADGSRRPDRREPQRDQSLKGADLYE